MPASRAFTALRGPSGDPTATMYRDALAKVERLLAPALASGAKVVALAPYTTHTRVRELFQLRETLEAEPIPTLSFDGTALSPMGAARFAKRVAGVLPAGFTASTDDWLGKVDFNHVAPAKAATAQKSNAGVRVRNGSKPTRQCQLLISVNC